MLAGSGQSYWEGRYAPSVGRICEFAFHGNQTFAFADASGYRNALENAPDRPHAIPAGLQRKRPPLPPSFLPRAATAGFG
jgi:hypothetical protein